MVLAVSLLVAWSQNIGRSKNDVMAISHRRMFRSSREAASEPTKTDKSRHSLATRSLMRLGCSYRNEHTARFPRSGNICTGFIVPTMLQVFVPVCTICFFVFLWLGFTDDDAISIQYQTGIPCILGFCPEVPPPHHTHTHNPSPTPTPNHTHVCRACEHVFGWVGCAHRCESGFGHM